MARSIFMGIILLLAAVPIAVVMDRGAMQRQLRDDRHLYPL